ncbi:PAP2 family [Micractinium conductrix]|uniref:PAP2 family n=1 Tax=Micractinium conductrix TaxID=554055 RepID=A0A2P6V8P2_9CHLO|nr:PAP2 family [Micractinium conductrix]|eukprot:PSC70460.1 PAP2 family [Micractinium conductrix]
MLSSPRLTRAPATRSLATRPNVTCSADEHAGARKRGPAVPQAAQRSDVGLSSLLGAPTTQQRAAVAQEPALPPATVLLGAGAAFTAVAANEFAPPSAPHLLQHLDASVHAWVSSSSAAWSAELQGLLAGKLVSDASIACGLAGWLGVAAVAVSARSPRLAGLLGLSSAAYCLGGGRMWRADPALVDTLKQAFHRVRPSEHHHTYAFPSGHTTAAAFICGTLLFVLLPAALQVVEEQQQQQQEGRSAPGEHNAAQRTAAWLVERRWQLCSAGVATTAAGRLLADVHWCSDVLAGACLGTALTAGLALLCGVPDMNSGAAGPASAAAEAPQASRRR